MSIHSICDSIHKIKNQIGETCLIAVSKYHTIQAIEEAYQCGQRDFGESRVQELAEKASYFSSKGISDIRWHFIGRLQSNKINQLLKIPHLVAIHSIDSVKLLNALLERAPSSMTPILLFLQYNTSSEEEKGGFRQHDDLIQAIDILQESTTGFVWAGLMTMGPIRTNNFESDTRQAFNELQTLALSLKKRYPQFSVDLSMGMSSDYQWAIEYGSRYIRVGSIIFEGE